MTDLQDRHIPGVNAKQIIGLGLAILTSAALYYDMRSQLLLNRQETIQNREYMQRIDSENKADRDFRRAEIQAFRQSQGESSVSLRMLELRVQLIEEQFKKK